MMRHNKKGGSDCEALAVFSICVYHAREGDSGAFLAFGEYLDVPAITGQIWAFSRVVVRLWQAGQA